MMAMVRVVFPETLPALTVKETLLNPALAKTWLGFRSELVPPSPKSQDQEAEVPVEVSVNWTACPSDGNAGL